MGKPMPGWDVQILDEDEQPGRRRRARRDLPAGALEPALSARLLEQPEAARETFGGEWFHTKDAAERDEDGYFWYSGRADDVIISAGYRIGPFEVESACIEHPAVREAAAVASPGRAARARGQGVHRAGRGHASRRTSWPTRSRRFVRGNLSAYAYPRRIEFVDELPKTLTGKIRRIELRESEHGRAETAS